jgi:lipopolysaccharide transport system ATP-binding protein
MSDIAIKFENISKQYRLGLVSTQTLSHDLNRWWQTTILRKEDPYLRIGETNDRATKATSDYVWALQNIDFEVRQGDVLGIIGKNGAGKSTLLKILSKVTAPTTGQIKAKGRIASLLEVGTGFHGEMTGRENIYMNGAILGMTKTEITRKLDEIVDFSGVERYLDTPVKRYSSGMIVRLGFAIAAHLDPEILVVDEVLAVGDVEFQKKAIGKMKDVSRGEGRTVLFVSHNMGAVRNLCHKGIVLKDGLINFVGEIHDCVNHYIQLNKTTHILHRIIDDSARLKGLPLDIYFVSVCFEKDQNLFASDEPITFLFEVKANKTTEDFRLNTTVFTADDIPIGGVFGTNHFSIKKGEMKKIKFSILDHHLSKGDYYVSFSIGVGNFITGQKDFDIIPQILSFKITQFSKEDDISFAQWDRSWGNIIFQSKTSIID